MTTSHHGRDQIDYVKIGVKRDGTITGIHINVIADLGAYYLLLTPFIPSFTAFVASGCYKIPRVRTDITGVFTNKFPTDAIRGAGRPEATHLLEMMVEQAAAELGHATARAAAQELHPDGGLPGRGRGRRRLRLRQLPRHARQARVQARPRRARARAGRAAREGHLPRHRLLHLHGDLRPRAVARGRPERRRHPGRLLGVRGRARAPVGLGDRVHRHLAARPGPGHDDGADRRRPPRRRPAASSRSSTATRAPARTAWAPTARARWRSAARPSHRAVDQGPGQGQADRRPHARGGAGGHRGRPAASSPSRARRTRA